MKSHKTRSLFYSVIVHALVLLLLFGLGWMVTEKVEKVSAVKPTVVMLSQVRSSSELPTAKVPPEKVVKPPKKRLQKPKKIKPKPVKKKARKPKKKPMVKKRVPLQKAPKIKEKVVEAKVVPKEVVEKVSEVAKRLPKEDSELIVTPDERVSLSKVAKEAIAKPTTPQSTPEDIYVKAHISEIMALLRKHLYYPRMARKRHMQGKVMVRFELLTDGSIRNITIIEAKRELLGKAAVTTIERLEGKFPLPSETLVLHVPIMYQLK